MKTALISALSATFLGFASLASGRPIDAADFVVIIFCTGLASWTVAQYSRTWKPLTLAPIARLPLPARIASAAPHAARLAA